MLKRCSCRRRWRRKWRQRRRNARASPARRRRRRSIDVAWYALFAREFTKALTVADRAHALLPDNLTIETNRAHALMFSERREESKALYLAHKGKPVAGR